MSTRKVIILTLGLCLITSLFIGCSKDKDDDLIVYPEEKPELPSEEEKEEESKESNITSTIFIDGIDNPAKFYSDCEITSIFESRNITSENVPLFIEKTSKVQSFFINDKNNSIYMISRVSNTLDNDHIEFNVENTALSLVTLHPFFSHVDSLAYDVLASVIRENKYFGTLCNEVSNTIKAKKALFDSNNVNININQAIDSLLIDLIDISVSDIYPDSRSAYESTDYFPFKLSSDGNTLNLQVFGLYPNYYGTIKHANGETKKLVVHSHDDFGGYLDFMSIISDMIKQNGFESYYGDVSRYQFPTDGEAKFDFNCRTTENQTDLWLRIVKSIYDLIGIRVPTKVMQDIAIELMHSCAQIINDASAVNGKLTFHIFPYFLADNYENIKSAGESVWNLAFDVVTQKTSEFLGKMGDFGYDMGWHDLKGFGEIVDIFRKIGTYNKVYTGTKTVSNIIARTIYSKIAPDQVSFKLCCYDDIINNCSNIGIYKGNDQIGIEYKKLKQPISVFVNIDMESTADYLVKFEVISGGGHVENEGYAEIVDYIAKAEWTLGSCNEEQVIHAYICKKSSKEKNSQHVEFKATAIKGEFDIQIVGGNNQVGYENTRLEENLQVALKDNSQIDYKYYQVKFEVESGGGSLSTEYAKFTAEGIAECNWTLGTQAQGEQKVKAVLVSAENKEVISEPVYFEAEIESEEDKELRSALIKLYQTTNGGNWANNTNWCSNKPLTEWYGVSKDEENHYTLSLNENNLTGLIDQNFPEGVFVNLDCSRNQLTSIKVSNSTSLTVLLCGFNQLTTLEVSGCTALTRLECISNQLTLLDLSDCMTLMDLDCSWNKFTSLDNITNGTSIKRLTCGYNPYNSFKISNFPVIEELSCPDMGSNDLLTIDVSNCTTLVKLNCHTNNVKEFNASGCTALTDINCWQCTFEIFNVAGCTVLKDIYFKNGWIKTSLDFSNCTSLTAIPLTYDSSSYGWTTLDVSGCTALMELGLNSGNLTSLDVSGCTALTSLGCSDNQLTSLDVSGCTALTSLGCFDNQLVDLNVTGCVNLTELRCSNNQLTTLDLSNLKSLESFYISGNQLTILDVSECTTLKQLNCNEGVLTSLDASGCSSLKSLQCSDNKLTNLNLSNCMSLENLNCSVNQLTTLNVSGLSALKLINCSYNLLTAFNVNGCTSLKGLYCGGNKLSALKITNLESLSYVNCEDNQLISLDLSGCKSLAIEKADPGVSFNGNPLTSINLSGTAIKDFNYRGKQLKTLNVSGCTSLSRIDCNGNQLTTLDASGCTALEMLYCQDNQLTTLDISECIALYELDCRNNRITKEIVGWFAQINYFFHDVRYSYYEVEDENGKKITKYEDNGVGWWYPGEPAKGKHIPN